MNEDTLVILATTIPTAFGIITPIVIRIITSMTQKKITKDLEACIAKLENHLDSSEARFKDIQDRIKHIGGR